jgi:hypothetical protein
MQSTNQDRKPRRFRLSPPVWVLAVSAIFGLVVGRFGHSLSTLGTVLLGALFGLTIAIFWMIPAMRRLRRRYETDPLRAKRQT